MRRLGLQGVRRGPGPDRPGDTRPTRYTGERARTLAASDNPAVHGHHPDVGVCTAMSTGGVLTLTVPAHLATDSADTLTALAGAVTGHRYTSPSGSTDRHRPLAPRRR